MFPTCPYFGTSTLLENNLVILTYSHAKKTFFNRIQAAKRAFLTKSGILCDFAYRVCIIQVIPVTAQATELEYLDLRYLRLT